MCIMKIVRLNHSNWEDIEKLYFECQEGVIERFQKRKDENDIDDEAIQGMEKVWALWKAGIQRYYLDDDEYHFLYGCYDKKKLITILGWRCDLPEPYNKDWVIAWMRSSPSVTATNKSLPLLWRKMFEVCEGKGLERWHAIVTKDRYTKFDAFERRYTPDIHKRYRYETSVDIPAGEKPNVEWVWSMMGRSILKEDKEVRTGTRIE